MSCPACPMSWGCCFIFPGTPGPVITEGVSSGSMKCADCGRHLGIWCIVGAHRLGLVLVPSPQASTVLGTAAFHPSLPQKAVAEGRSTDSSSPSIVALGGHSCVVHAPCPSSVPLGDDIFPERSNWEAPDEFADCSFSNWLWRKKRELQRTEEGPGMAGQPWT